MHLVVQAHVRYVLYSSTQSMYYACILGAAYAVFGLNHKRKFMRKEAQSS